MRPIEKRVIDDPMNNIATRKLAIKQAKKMRNGSRSKSEKRDIDKLIERLEKEIQEIIDKQKGVTNEEPKQKEPVTQKEKQKTPEEVKAILDRLNKIQEKFNSL